jgi:hypothetical protein
METESSPWGKKLHTSLHQPENFMHCTHTLHITMVDLRRCIVSGRRGCRHQNYDCRRCIMLVNGARSFSFALRQRAREECNCAAHNAHQIQPLYDTSQHIYVFCVFVPSSHAASAGLIYKCEIIIPFYIFRECSGRAANKLFTQLAENVARSFYIIFPPAWDAKLKNFGATQHILMDPNLMSYSTCESCNKSEYL